MNLPQNETRLGLCIADADNLAIVIVGDRKSIEPTLKATNIGNVVVVDMTGRPVM